MPQDSFRSVVYRSFVTCADPQGVAEGATIRKSKTDSRKMGGGIRVESQVQPKALIRSSSCKGGEKEIVEKKAKELDDNLSSFQLMEVKKGAQKLNQVIDLWSNGVSFEGRTEDIAKDLLRGALDLQESLTMLGKLQEASQYMTKLKKKQKEKVYEMEVERNGLDHLENRNYEMGRVQKPRISVDESSRDCYEELRDAIRDGLGKQNLLPIGSYEQRAYYNDRRKVEQSSDMPSTSSSRSSAAYSYEFASSDSFSSKITDEKPKGTNLIARLMGLEDISSNSLQSTPQKQLERDKAFSLKRPVFDIDLPMTRKPQFVVQKVDRVPMTLDKIIEVMQLKGLLRSNNHQSYLSNSSFLNKTFRDDAPPIVLMKPHRTFQRNTRVFENDMAQSWKPAEDFPLKIKKVNTGVMNEQESSIKNIRKEKGDGNFKERVTKAEDEDTKVSGKSYPTKVKVSASPSSKPQKKEVIEKKVYKIQKLAPARKKPEETDNVKPSINHNPRTQEKVTLSKETKPEGRSTSLKSRQVSPQKPSTTNPIQRSKSPRKYSDGRKNGEIEKPVSKSLDANVRGTKCETDCKQIDISCENESYMNGMDAAPAVRSQEPSDDNHQHSLPEATQLSTEHVSEFEASEEVILCSPEINKIDYLDIDACRALVLQKISTFHDSDTANSKLLLDCANELLEHKDLKQFPVIYPFLQNQRIKSRFGVSVDQLTRDVSDGLEKLNGYCKCTKESPRADTIQGMLERDLLLKGAWDMGWRDGFSLEEVEEVVGDLDKILLCELIENVFTDFLSLAL